MLRLLPIILMLASCAPPNVSELSNVYGEDSRKPFDFSVAPWNAVGRLSSRCTGVLVAKNLVLTAAHCVFDANGKLIPTFGKFYLQQKGEPEKSFVVSPIVWGPKKPRYPRGLDWAVLKLEGKVKNWAKVKLVSAKDTPKMISVGGYPNDLFNGQVGVMHKDCMVRYRQSGLVFHDCDTVRGMSGGPVFSKINGEILLVGILVAERRYGLRSLRKLKKYSHKFANIALPSRAFVKALEKLKRRPDM